MELLVVIAIVSVLAALLLPSISRAKAAARKATCINNERQINVALRLCAEENAELVSATNPVYFAYKEMVQPYLQRSGTLVTNDQLFACPADDFNMDVIIGNWFVATGFTNVSGRGFHRQPFTHFSSYALNESVRRRPSGPTNLTVAGVGLKAFDYVREPVRTVLIGEISGCVALSGHDRKERFQFRDAKNVMSFVDGHVGYIRIYWNGLEGPPGMPWFYEPAGGYEYKWSAN